MVNSSEEYFKKATVNTGFKSIDEFNLFQTNGITTVFGRPATGKTSFALNIVINLLKRDKHCVIFSLNESKRETECALACITAAVDVNKIKTGEANEGEKERYGRAIEWLKTRKVEIYDGHFTAVEIHKKVVKEPDGMWFRAIKPDLVLIDDLSAVIPTRLNNGIGVLRCIKDKNTAVIVTAHSTYKAPDKLKDKELIKISDKVIRLKNATRTTRKGLKQPENRDGLDDVELTVVKNEEGKKGKIILKRKLLTFTEKESGN